MSCKKGIDQRQDTLSVTAQQATTEGSDQSRLTTRVAIRRIHTYNLESMPNQNQLGFLFTSVSTFTILLLLSNLIASYLNIRSPFFNFLQYRSQSMDTVIDNIRSSPIVATAVILLVGACLFLLFTTGLLSPRSPVLDSKTWKEFPLAAKIIVSPNTALYRFALPKKKDILGLPIGQHISIAAEINGKDIVRSYTPTSSDDDIGHFDLLVKTYEKGNISRYLSLLNIGEKIRVRGPKGQFKYQPGLCRSIGMVAGGTGITPMLQIIRAVLKNSLDNTKLSLIYANVGESDILLKKELDELAVAHPSRFKVFYVLNNPPAGWNGGVGFVSKEHIRDHLFPAADDCKALLCGPPPMINAMKKHLEDLNFAPPRAVSKLNDQVFLF